MTNEELLEDIKQLITATVNQTETRLTARFHGVESRLGNVESRLGNVESRLGNVESRLGNVESRLVELSDKMDNGFAGVGEAIADINDRLDKRDVEVEHRLTHLEQKTA